MAKVQVVRPETSDENLPTHLEDWFKAEYPTGEVKVDYFGLHFSLPEDEVPLTFVFALKQSDAWKATIKEVGTTPQIVIS
jgi:hypothetical protein